MIKKVCSSCRSCLVPPRCAQNSRWPPAPAAPASFPAPLPASSSSLLPCSSPSRGPSSAPARRRPCWDLRELFQDLRECRRERRESPWDPVELKSSVTRSFSQNSHPGPSSAWIRGRPRWDLLEWFWDPQEWFWDLQEWFQDLWEWWRKFPDAPRDPTEHNSRVSPQNPAPGERRAAPTSSLPVGSIRAGGAVSGSSNRLGMGARREFQTRKSQEQKRLMRKRRKKRPWKFELDPMQIWEFKFSLSWVFLSWVFPPSGIPKMSNKAVKFHFLQILG